MLDGMEIAAPLVLGLKLVWTGLVGSAMSLLWRAVDLSFHIENTTDAVRETARAQVLVGWAVLLLLVAASLALTPYCPWWVGALLLAPALAGLWLATAGTTVLPFLAVLATYPLALVAVVSCFRAGGR